MTLPPHTHRADRDQYRRAEFFLPPPAQVHETGGAGQNKKNGLADGAAIAIERLLPVLSHHPGKTEDKRSRPENGAGAGKQDEFPSDSFSHHDLMGSKGESNSGRYSMTPAVFANAASRDQFLF